MAWIDDLLKTDWHGGHVDVRRSSRLAEGFSAPSWREAAGDALSAGWAKLGTTAATPNPFFEPMCLLPSLLHFDPGGKVRLAVLVEHGRLVGLMPLWRDPDYHGKPLPNLAAWHHANMFCGEPLISEGRVEAFWSALLAWCDTNERGCLFAHFASLPNDGESYRALHSLCAADLRPLKVVERVERAALRSGPTPDDYLASTLAKKRRKELQRKRRRLEESGEFVFSRKADADGLQDWIDHFLELEQRGWKGREGSALACDPRTETFFRDTLYKAAEADRLERLAFYLDGKAVAMLCNFIAPPMSFAFKTTFDEDIFAYSPGVLLQVENLALLERSDIDLSDSCAAPGHPMIDGFWRNRREMSKVSIGIGGRLRRRVGGVLSAIEVRRAEKRK